MDEDDDAPPLLVAADAASAADPDETTLSTKMEDVKLAKVPITIITGMMLPCHEPHFRTQA